MQFKNIPIRRKLALIILLASSAVLLLASAVLVSYNVFVFRRELVENDSVLADAVGNNCAAAIDFNDPKAAGETLGALQANDNIMFACVYTRDGRVFAVYQRDRALPFAPPIAGEVGWHFTHDQLQMFRSVKQGGEVVGTIFVSSDLKDMWSSLQRYGGIVGLVFLVSLLVALALSSWLQRLISDPILHLAGLARSVALDKNYSVRASWEGDDELGQLVDGFNDMLVQIQQRDTALRSASDELEARVLQRTAELKTSNETLLGEISERKRTSEELLGKTAFLVAQVNSSLDGILVVDQAGGKLLQNQRVAELFKIPRNIADDKDDQKQRHWVADMCKHPDAFTEKVAALNSHPSEISRDELELKNGTILDRYSAPVVGHGGRCYGRIWSFRDITERKRNDESVRLLGSAVEQAKESIVITDAELNIPGPRIIFVNPAFTKMTGYSAADAIGKTPRILQGPRTDRAVLNRLRRNLESGEMFEGEAINYRKDGTEFDLEWQIAPIRDAGGMITHFVAIQRDITARKRTEIALRESDEKFRQLADNISDAFWIRSPDMHKVHYVSPAFAQIWGRSVDSLYATPAAWADYIFPEDRERVRDAFDALTGDSPSLDLEYRIVRPDGEIRWVHVRGFQVRDATNKLIRHTGIVSDITDRKRLEDARRESEERFRKYFEMGLIGMVVSSPEKGCLDVNDELCQILGYTRSELLQMSWATFTHPDDLAADVANFDKMLAGESEGYSMDKRFIRKDGAVIHSIISVKCVRSADGAVDYVLGLVQDITERKRLEAQLFESQKMDTVGKLAGGVAHEFNSILTAIIGQSEMLLGELPAGSPLTKNATEISKAAGRAATLTRQLLAYGRKQFLQTETLDLNRVLAGMADMLRHLMRSDVDLRIAPADVLHAVKVDAGQFQQVIIHLAANARDAMPHGGKLTIETADVTLSQDSVGRPPELAPGNYVMVAITDTGTGMSADVKARAFEPFSSTKGVGQGVGLGLATCYGIVKQSGGHIGLDTELGRGTTFKIYLPQVEQTAKASIPRSAAPELPRGTETILLVEDDSALREMAAALLRRLGYTVLAAANGVEALSLRPDRDSKHIDLVITDVVMPHMSGKELAGRIQALYPQIRILFTSAYTGNAIAHHGLVNQGVAILQKPFTPSALACKLREVLDQPGDATPDTAENAARLTPNPEPITTGAT